MAEASTPAPTAAEEADTSTGPAGRRRVWQLVRWVVGVLTVLFIVRVAIDQADELRGVNLTVRPLWLPVAAIFSICAGLVLPLAWRHILTAYGWQIGRGRALRIWCLSQATRYLPTGAVAVASRLSLTAAEGVPRAVAGASFAVESLLLVGWATLIGAVFIPSSVVSTPTRLVLGLGAAFGLTTLPWTLRIVGGRMKRFEALAPERLRLKELVEAIALFGVNSTLRAARFLALAVALLPLTMGDVPLVLGAGYAGVVAGMIGITPAGLGVREGVIVAILAGEFGVGDAAALAVALRAWDLVFEVGFLAVATWVGRHRAPSESPVDSER
jgi:glycosyltransferase 2 family protein